MELRWDKIIGTSGMSFVEKPPILAVPVVKWDFCQVCYGGKCF